MGWFENGVVCRWHPYHCQPQGVCSICVVEKLQLFSRSPDPYNTIRTVVTIPSTSFSVRSSPSISPVHQSSMSPVHDHHHRSHRRHASTGGGLRFVVSGAGGAFVKSRSVAFIVANHGGGRVEEKKHDKGNRFWKKLISKGTKTVSRTVKPAAYHN